VSVAVAIVFAPELRKISQAGTVIGRLPEFCTAGWVRYPRLAWLLAVPGRLITAREAPHEPSGHARCLPAAPGICPLAAITLGPAGWSWSEARGLGTGREGGGQAGTRQSR